MEDLSAWIQQNGWCIKLILSLLMGVVISLVEYFLYRYYLPKAKAKQQRWREIIITAIHGPFLCYVWLIVVTLILQVLSHRLNLNGDTVSIISSVRRAFTLLFIFWFVMRFICVWEKHTVCKLENGDEKKFKDQTSVNGLALLFQIIAIVVTVLMLLATFGISISTLLAFGGIGGLAISFAAKDSLANFIGGLMIYWDRPFSVGDWISSPDRKIEGTVRDIGWRLTRIQTFDKRPLFVPNGVFSTISVENPSRMTNRRIKTIMGVRYEDATKVEVIIKDMEDMLKNHPEIDTEQTCFVNLVEFGASALNILIYTFTKTTNWVKFESVRQDVFLKFIEIVTKHGAQFAYPTSTIYLPDLEKNEVLHGPRNTEH